jgi:hypothetical protein
MLDRETNELLTRIGAGTPMGELYRNYDERSFARPISEKLEKQASQTK